MKISVHILSALDEHKLIMLTTYSSATNTQSAKHIDRVDARRHAYRVIQTPREREKERES